MEDYSSQVPLQPSVEELIRKICLQKCIPAPDVSARRLLATITEASAIGILNKIAASSNIRTFSGFIVHMVKENSVATSSTSNQAFHSPQRRLPPSSFTAGDPQKSACYFSPNVHSPGSTSKSRTIPEYFPRSPNDGYGSPVSKQIISFPSLGLKDADPNTATYHLTESSTFTHRVSSVQKQLTFSPCSSSRDANLGNISQQFSDPSNANNRVSPVQKQLIFSPGCSLDPANPSKERQNFFDSPNANHLFSAVQKQPTLSWCSSSKGASPTSIAKPFSSAIHHGSLIQEKHTLSPCENFGATTSGNLALGFGSMTPNHSDGTNRFAISQQSLLLAELEFRKMFLVYSYVGRKRLEGVVSVEDAIEIKSMKSVSMIDYEAKIWAKYGRQFCEPSDRAMHFDWDSGKTYLYHCYVCADGNYLFKGPYLNPRRTHLQRELGDDNVLIVQFTDGPDTPDVPSYYCTWIAAYERIAGGISIGLRHYRLLAYKDGRGDNKNQMYSMKKQRSSWAAKCYFVRKESHAPWDERDPYILLNKTNHEARCLFMHVHTVPSMAKYISRFALTLSNTIKLRVDLASVHVERIEDIPCRDENGFVVCDEDGETLIHTDGTGFISEDLAILCAKDFTEAKGKKDDNYELIDLLKLEEVSLGQKGREACIIEPPLLVQCRLFKEGYAVKGTLLVNRKLKNRTIQIRSSMIKVEKDARLSHLSSFSSLEIVSISRRPRKANLSRNLIALLTVGGVPRKCFSDLLKSTLQEAHKVSSSMRAAVRVGLTYGQMDDSATSVAMIGCGIPLDEPYLKYRLSILANEERKGLRNGKIPINESFYLIGTADPTGILNSDEVCVILESGQISGKVLVYRNPGIHFGDIHILNAKYVAEMEDFVGNARYGIFFSTKGRRSVGSEIANGDFDGDLYWVSRNPQLLHHFKVSEPWERIYSTPSAPSKKPSELSHEELENELCTLLFATQKQNMVAGKAADSWLTFMDQYLILGEDDADEKHQIKEKLLKLVDLYYDALDAPKSGKKVEIPKCLLPPIYPHFLEKKTEKTYISSSVLGEIYDTGMGKPADNASTQGEIDTEMGQLPDNASTQGQIYDTGMGQLPDNASTQDIWKLPCFNVEIPEASLNLWKDRYRSYRQDMRDAMNAGDESKTNSANIVIKKYKQMFYEAEDFATSTRKIEDLYNEALAIYHTTYDYARSINDLKKCGFAWKVAGEALCSFHEMKTPGRSFPFKLAVLSMFI
ncbi:hypothetical protein L6452_21670 [Arctium lappa]|uniref:Uncharacterized protein n=1 Tax=Arctium lappa TaxID=4217 RepID=A0ACB9AXQ9_ARCLA|nr:hypothetical protein L6452_21670 [Arctium lappa]